jgi:hypothetical protein
VVRAALEPGVSRGVPGVCKGNADPTPELDRAYVLALEYLTDLAQGVGPEVS